MAFLALLIGVVLIVAALRNTHSTLFAALGHDVPGFVIWGAAIFGVAVIGFIPGLKPVSRGLLALVVVVIVLTNYKQILAGFQGATFGAQAQASGSGGGASSTSSGPTDFLSQVAQSTGFDFSSLQALDSFGHGSAVNG